jgi:CBS domain-containing protein
MRGRTKPGGATGTGLWLRWEQRRGVAVTSTGKTAEADVAYIGMGETLRQAGHRMRQLGVAALPVRGEDGQFQGIITRDMVAEAMAAGGDPKTITVGEIASTYWSPPSTVRHVVPVSDAWGRRNRHVAPVTGDHGRTWEATGGSPTRHRPQLRIGELADAVRAAEDAISQLSAVTSVPDPLARRPSARADNVVAARTVTTTRSSASPEREPEDDLPLQRMRTTSGLEPAADGPGTRTASPACPAQEPTSPRGWPLACEP